jgi:bla regulator protein blaR1
MKLAKSAKIGIWLCMVPSMYCQESSAKFEVASVKPGGSGGLTRYLPNGGVRFTGVTLRNLVSIAYGVRLFQVIGGPGWIDIEGFDIDARPPIDSANPADPATLSIEQRKVGERLRSLLADRFGLTIHRESREQPVYALVAAKEGPKLKESATGTNFVRASRGSITGQSVGLRMLVINLANVLDRQVIDKTGLTGSYDFELKWTPDIVSSRPDGPPPPSDTDEPSLFTALSDQLGLKLESAKAPVQVWVIDGVEKPSLN